MNVILYHLVDFIEGINRSMLDVISVDIKEKEHTGHAVLEEDEGESILNLYWDEENTEWKEEQYK